MKEYIGFVLVTIVAVLIIALNVWVSFYADCQTIKTWMPHGQAMNRYIS